MGIPTPEEFFGYKPGATGMLYNWPEMVQYFELLAENSPRVAVRHMGASSDGNPFIVVFISEADTIADLEKYRRISMRLSDPKGLSAEEERILCKTGKAVCLQMSGQHAYELSPTQNSPALAWTLATGEDERTQEILKNTILILIPTANPDGLIDCYNWNEQVKGTGHERFFSPHIYAKYTGHGNNRDNLYENIVETKYLNQLLYREWMPQVMVDQHQGYSGGPAFHFGAAATNDKLADGMNPLLVREMQLLTADVAYSMTENGFRNVYANCTSYSYSYSHTDNARAHNIIGILSELLDTTFTADGSVSADRLTLCRGSMKPTALMPEADTGYRWTRQDAVDYIHEFELSLLLACARNRERLLQGMAAKARQQTKRGGQDPVKAYVIAPKQHDASAKRRLVQILHAQGVEFYEAKEEVRAGNIIYPKESLIVFCAQPKYMLVKNMFHVKKTPEADCNIHINESEITTVNMALLLGVEIHEVRETLTGRLEIVQELPKHVPVQPFAASENESYLEVNKLLNQGCRVYYDEETQTYSAAGGKDEMKKARIGLFRLSRFLYFRWDQVSNDENPYTAMILDRYGFDWKYVSDQEIRCGVPEDIDILIIPGEWRTALEQGDRKLEEYPDEYTCGLGEVGAEKLREFVARGGRLIAWSSAAGWAIHAFDLRIQDGKKLVQEGIPYWERHPYNAIYGNRKELTREDLCVCGPMLMAYLEKDRLTRGMPRALPVLAEDPGPVMRVAARMEDFPFTVDYDVIGYYGDRETMHINGEVRGLKYLEHASCLVRTHIGEGEVILYSFDPKFRGQTECTFKLLFNALYL